MKQKGQILFRSLPSLLFVSFLALTFTLSTFLAVAAEIKISGASTIQPIVKDAAKLFESATGIKIVLSGGGSGVGVKDAESGTSAIGMVSRELSSEEAKNLVATTIAGDGVGVIVHANNPVSAISKEQVIKIYTGQATNWKEFGGPDKKIVVESKEEGRSTKELFEHFFALKGKVVSQHIIGSNAEAIAFVSGEEASIGYVSVGTAEGAILKGTKIKLLTLDGSAATSENVSNKSYPLRRPLNLVTKGAASGDAKKFIDFMLGAEGQKIIKEKDFVPVK